MDNKNMSCDHKSLNVIKSKLNMESKVIGVNDDVSLKVSLVDNFYAVVKDDTDYEANRPFYVCLYYEDIPIYNVLTGTVENSISFINDMKKVAEGLVILGYDDIHDVKSLANEVGRMFKRRERIHNLLVDATFKIGDDNSIITLKSMGIDVNDYILKDKSFMNKKTKKFVVIY